MKPIDKPHMTIIDRPCGTGKTSAFMRSFDPDKRYLVVTPLLSEVKRIINNANVPFHEPTTEGESATKAEDLQDLLLEGCNVVTTHKLYQQIARLAQKGYLDGHHIIIDEVLDVCRQVDGKTPRSFQKFYLEDGFATVDKDGKVNPTALWDAEFDAVSDTLAPHLYHLATAGMLYIVDGQFFMWVLPEELLRAGRSITIYTYLADGSMLLAYLRKLNIAYLHDTDADAEQAIRDKAKELITIETIPVLEGQAFSYSGQTKSKGKAAREKKVGNALKKLRENKLRNVSMENVLVTCAKGNWFKDGKSGSAKPTPGGFAKNSRMFTSATWISNTTRGTNEHAHCSHLVYLYNQHMNPFIRRWLGLAHSRSADDAYALTELIQWIYRSRVRRGEPITVYMPSKRMRDLLSNWMNTPVEKFAWSGELVRA